VHAQVGHASCRVGSTLKLGTSGEGSIALLLVESARRLGPLLVRLELFHFENLVLIITEEESVSRGYLLVAFEALRRDHETTECHLLGLASDGRLDVPPVTAEGLRANGSVDKGSMGLPKLIHRLKDIVVEIKEADILRTGASLALQHFLLGLPSNSERFLGSSLVIIQSMGLAKAVDSRLPSHMASTMRATSGWSVHETVFRLDVIDEHFVAGRSLRDESTMGGSRDGNASVPVLLALGVSLVR